MAMYAPGKLSEAACAALYAASPRLLTRGLVTDETFTIRPYPRLFMPALPAARGSLAGS